MKNICIITGASSGMGKEFALQLDSIFLGSKVDEIWLIARRRKELAMLAGYMEMKTRILDMDLNDPIAIHKLSRLFKRENPIIRMLVNCAGYGVFGSFHDSSCKAQTGMIDTNCKALTRMTYLCIPYMKRGSRLIQLASSAAFMPQPEFAVYAATKSYVYSFSKALGRELLKKKIYVTTVCPGPVDTPFFDVAYKYHAMKPFKKFFMATPEEVVEKAIHDSYKKRKVSVYGIGMQAFYIASKIIPHDLILLFLK